MNRRASKLRTGDRIGAFDLFLTISQVHIFPEFPIAPNVVTPACVLLFFEGTELTLSLGPDDRVRLCR